MSKKRRHQRPSDPAEIARRAYERRKNPEYWGVNEDALKLSENAGVVHEAATRERGERAQRYDVFALLRNAKRGPKDAQVPALPENHYDAIQKFQEDLAIRHRTAGANRTLSRIDNATGGGAWDAVVAAGARVDAVLAKIGPRQARILLALCEPVVIHGRNIKWREVVQRHSGETDEKAQVAVVRALAEDVFDAYETIAPIRRKADGSERGKPSQISLGELNARNAA